MLVDVFGLSPATWLPLAFAGLMAVSILAYVVLDGYDLGVGLLMARATQDEKDRMIASIGPFWDANETWLVLGVGLLLVAFPIAHGMILTALYLPVALMLFGLILRGVAFEFRAKVGPEQKIWWNRVFVAGSLVTALTQGFMLGLYVMGFAITPATIGFALLSGVCVAAGYAYIGAAWLILKTEGALQEKAVAWAKAALALTAFGMVAVSLATPFVSERIFARWFAFPGIIALAPIPLVTGTLFAILFVMLSSLPRPDDRWAWVPFAGGVALFVLAFAGLAYSFYPYVVPERLTVWQASAAPESLIIILMGAAVMVPVIAAYSAFSYWVFRGKATTLTYH
jgi:cytochrome d ubiquinol oxidase subunit II